MAYIITSNDHNVIATSQFIKVFPKNDNKKTLSFEHEYKKNENENSALEVVDCISFSPDFQYFAALFSDKTLKVWSTGTVVDGFWKEFGNLTMKRRSTSLAFSPDGENIFVADKSGDLYSFSLDQDKLSNYDTENLQPIIGHISMLLNVTITNDHVITADRDEKIRVSERCRPYVIDNFCLGHTEFVCRLVQIKGNHLVSASGDRTIKVWDYVEGKQIQTVNIGGRENGDKSVPSLLAYSNDSNLLAVSSVDCPQPCLHVYSVSYTPNTRVNLLYAIPFAELNKQGANQLIDLEFVDVNNCTTLYVLVSTDSGGKLKKIECALDRYKFASEGLESINSVLQSIPTEQFKTKTYKEMFKCCVTGHKYDAFHAKKNKLQEKVAAQAKKLKLVT